MENKDIVEGRETPPGTLLVYSLVLVIIPVAVFLHPAFTGNLFFFFFKPYTYNLIYWGPLFFFVGLVLAIKAFFRFRSYKSLTGQILSAFIGLLHLAVILIDLSLIKSSLMRNV